MIRSLFVASILAVTTLAQNPPVPGECVAGATDAAAVTVTYGGKTYRLTNEACRAQFLGDPERYSQLYDALLELAAEGTPLRAQAAASLVPS